MRHSGISDWLLVSQIVGYSVSTIVVLLLAVLVRRAARFEDARAYRLLVASVGLWNVGKLVSALAELVGLPAEGALVQAAQTAAFAGGAMTPAGALAMWLRLGPTGPHSRWLLRAASAGGAILIALQLTQFVAGDWLAVGHRLWTVLAYHVALFFTLGAWEFHRIEGTAPSARVGVVLASLGALGVGLAVTLPSGPSAPGTGLLVTMEGGSFWPKVLSQLSTHLITLGTLLFFARFRFADVFVRQCLRMIAAAVLGFASVALMGTSPGMDSGLTGMQATAVALTVRVMALAGLLLAFAIVDRAIVTFVDQGLFRQPDYGLVRDRLRESLASVREPAAVYAAASQLLRNAMALHDVRVVPHSAIPDGSQPLMIPVPTREPGEALAVTPGWDHPTLLEREVEFLRASAAVLGHRLDAVRREQDEIDRHTREADLRRQVSEATLKALQAQVNPHFLFNTLNTIADLIQEDPAGAEAMTLRLAEVFSHVLASSGRPFNSVSQEMAFLRTYLTIEEARFGDRLRVEFAIDPAVAHAVIPSLILQPAVENALKHGLARKIGPGQLTISAVRDGDGLQLAVEDDGVGPSPDASTPRIGGVGLRNIAERLETLYADRASVCLAAGPGGGSILTIRLPLHTQ